MRISPGKYSLLLTVLVLLLTALISFQRGSADLDLTKLQDMVLGEITISPAPSLVPQVTQSETAVVTRIIDGDTIELSDGRKVRYIGIDTPETKAPNTPVQCFGQQASEFNQQLVKDKAVRLEKDVNNTDRYGRLLRYVYVDDQFVNEMLVAEGYAVASSYPPDIAKQDQLRAAEAQAQQTGKGLWSSCPLP